MSSESEGRERAERFRDDHHLGTQPLGDLVAIIEQSTGYDVAIVDAGPDEHGLTVRDPDREVVFIAVARTSRPMRQRSTLAHELAHVLLGDGMVDRDGEWSARAPEEVRADAFARHLLIPVPGLRDLLGDREAVTTSDLSDVVQRFLVSPAIAAIALSQAGYIPEATKQAWKSLSTPNLAVRFGWADQYGMLKADSCRRRAPQRLLVRAIAGYRERVVSAQAIATLRGADVESVERELAEAGIEPVSPPIDWADPDDLPDINLDLGSLDEPSTDH